MRAKFVRGQDPKSVMGLGYGPEYAGLSKMAKKFGFAETSPTYPDAAITWNHPEKGNVHYVHGNTPFFWDRPSADPKKWYVMVEPAVTGERYPDEASVWVDPAVWRASFDIVNESVNFERGQDPKDAMGVGMTGYRKMKEFLEYKVESIGGEQSIIEKQPDHLLHYYEGCWTTPEGWTFYILHDIKVIDDIKWYVSTFDPDTDQVFGKDTFDEATEWIGLQYQSKKDQEGFNRFMQITH